MGICNRALYKCGFDDKSEITSNLCTFTELDIIALTRFVLNELFCHIYWKNPFSFSGVLDYVKIFSLENG